MVRFFSALGAPLLAFVQYLGELVLLAADTFRSIFTHKLRWKLFLNQVVEIGLLSQLVVIITGAFTGARAVHVVLVPTVALARPGRLRRGVRGSDR